MLSVTVKMHRSIGNMAKIYVGEKYHTILGGVGFSVISNARSGHERTVSSDLHSSYAFDDKHRPQMRRG